MTRKRGRRRSFLVELIVVLAVAGVLTVAALPMYSRYLARVGESDARGDLKMLYASVEAYYTAQQDVPVKAEKAISHWVDKYSGKYSFTRYAPRHYEFVTRKKFNGVYLYIDERGTVEKRR